MVNCENRAVFDPTKCKRLITIPHTTIPIPSWNHPPFPVSSTTYMQNSHLVFTTVYFLSNLLPQPTANTPATSSLPTTPFAVVYCPVEIHWVFMWDHLTWTLSADSSRIYFHCFIIIFCFIITFCYNFIPFKLFSLFSFSFFLFLQWLTSLPLSSRSSLLFLTTSYSSSLHHHLLSKRHIRHRFIIAYLAYIIFIIASSLLT